jgi:putative transposase
MKTNNDMRQGRHCVFQMHVHLVFVAKYRRKVFDKVAIARLHELLAEICGDFEAELIGMAAHAKLTSGTPYGVRAIHLPP